MGCKVGLRPLVVFFHFAKQFFLRSGLPWLLMLLLVWFGCLLGLVGLYCIVVLLCVVHCLLYCQNTESKAYIFLKVALLFDILNKFSSFC